MRGGRHHLPRDDTQELAHEGVRQPRSGWQEDMACASHMHVKERAGLGGAAPYADEWPIFIRLCMLGAENYKPIRHVGWAPLRRERMRLSELSTWQTSAIVARSIEPVATGVR